MMRRLLDWILCPACWTGNHPPKALSAADLETRLRPYHMTQWR